MVVGGYICCLLSCFRLAPCEEVTTTVLCNSLQDVRCFIFAVHLCFCRTLEMEELFLRSTWPSFHWRWDGRRRHPMLWRCRWMQKERSNMMPSPDKDRARTRYTGTFLLQHSVRLLSTHILKNLYPGKYQAQIKVQDLLYSI